MDDPPILLNGAVALLPRGFSGPGSRLLAVGGLTLFSCFSSVNAQQAPRPDTVNALRTPCPDIDCLRAKEKATPFENFLLDKVENDIRANPLKAPDIVSEALVTDVSNPLTFAGHLLQRANKALGQNLNRVEIARIILAAVKARPEAVLEIVRGAIQTTPARFHSNIVAAAVAGIPDPYLRAEVITVCEIFGETLNIRRQPILEDRILCTEGNQEFVQESALGYETTTLLEEDGKTSITRSRGELAKTLAEAIIDAAIQAGSPESSFELTQAVDLVLQNNLGFLSIEGNPADSSTLITVPPPVTPTPSPPRPTPTPTPTTPTPTPSPVSP
jgi:hypothetical protein